MWINGVFYLKIKNWDLKKKIYIYLNINFTILKTV